jgi:hypothetical protein
MQKKIICIFLVLVIFSITLVACEGLENFNSLDADTAWDKALFPVILLAVMLKYLPTSEKKETTEAVRNDPIIQWVYRDADGKEIPAEAPAQQLKKPKQQNKVSKNFDVRKSYLMTWEYLSGVGPTFAGPLGSAITADDMEKITNIAEENESLVVMEVFGGMTGTLNIDLITGLIWGGYDYTSDDIHYKGDYKGSIDKKTLEIICTSSGTVSSGEYTLSAIGGTFEGTLSKDHSYASGTGITNEGEQFEWEAFAK